ncbi:MAG: hypothetical protein IJP04_09480 [Clostridia bacterium]|nr:hypothetical protein [Clostridia bacterium]
MMKELIKHAGDFIYRFARALDVARFQYHFEHGSAENVLRALAAYQNEDGGLGHGLDADCWNPNSSPIGTNPATQILREINAPKDHPIVQGIIRYLLSGADFDGKCWFNVVPTNDDYPCAPWWRMGSVSTCHADYNPGASLAGFLLRYADKGSDAYAFGLRIAREAYAAKMAKDPLIDMHESACYVQLLQDARAAGIESTEELDLDKLEENLKIQVKHCMVKTREGWDKSYICRPSTFIKGKDSIFYPDHREMADYECDFLKNTQLPDGAWAVTWKWDRWEEEWAISKTWWKGQQAVDNLLYLRGMGKL